MGYIKHHAIVVTSEFETHIMDTHKQAKLIFGDSCSCLIQSPVNRFLSFFVAPDGSKEGWDASERGDAKRKAFETWIEERNLYIDAVEISFGGDDKELLNIRNMQEWLESE